MIRSKTCPPFCSILVPNVKPPFLVVGVSLLNYHALANHIQACATVYPEEGQTRLQEGGPSGTGGATCRAVAGGLAHSLPGTAAHRVPERVPFDGVPPGAAASVRGALAEGWVVLRGPRQSLLAPLHHRGRFRRRGDSLGCSLDQSIGRSGRLGGSSFVSSLDLSGCGRRGICRALARLILRLRRRQVFGATYDSLGVFECLDAREFLSMTLLTRARVSYRRAVDSKSLLSFAQSSHQRFAASTISCVQQMFSAVQGHRRRCAEASLGGSAIRFSHRESTFAPAVKPNDNNCQPISRRTSSPRADRWQAGGQRRSERSS